MNVRTNFFVYLIILVISHLLVSCSSNKTEEISPYEKMQRQTINFIAQPTFSGDYIFDSDNLLKFIKYLYLLIAL
jgi:hypothetical protein